MAVPSHVGSPLRNTSPPDGYSNRIPDTFETFPGCDRVQSWDNRASDKNGRDSRSSLPVLPLSNGNATSGQYYDATDPWKRVNLLSLDGGGVRGISSLFILRELMHIVARTEKELDPGTEFSAASSFLRRRDSIDQNRDPLIEDAWLPCHYFDYIGGTGTGGVIAIMLGRLRFSAKQAIEDYQSIWKNVALQVSRRERLSPSRKKAKEASTRRLVTALGKMLHNRQERTKSYVGHFLGDSWNDASFDEGSGEDENTLCSDEERCKTLVLSVEVDAEKGIRRPYLFRSYEFNEERATSCNRRPESYGHPVSTIDACKATSADPKYFASSMLEDKTRTFQDGSLWSRNPSMELYREISSMHPREQGHTQNFVSLGCGEQQFSRFRQSFTGTREHNVPFQWDEIAVDLVLNDRARKSPDFHYQRFAGPGIRASTAMRDRKSDSTEDIFQRIELVVKEWCSSPKIQIALNECAESLVKCRRRRCETTRWERFALGVYYQCQACKIAGGEILRCEDRDDFLDHLERVHRAPAPDKDNYQDIQAILKDSMVTRL